MTQPEGAPRTPARQTPNLTGVVARAVVLALLLWFVFTLVLRAALHVPHAGMIALAVAVVVAGGFAVLGTRAFKSSSHATVLNARNTQAGQPPAETIAVLALSDAQQGIAAERFVAAVLRKATAWRVSTATLVLLPLLGGGFVALGLKVALGPVTCAGEVMNAGDRCVNLRTGSSRSSSDIAGAIAQQWWFWAVIAVVLLAIWIWKLYRRWSPAAADVRTFRTAVSQQQGIGMAAQHTDDETVRARLAEYTAAHTAAAARAAERLRVQL